MDIIRSLEDRIISEFIRIQKEKNDADKAFVWNEFTNKLFEEVKQQYPYGFQTKEDLRQLRLRINSNPIDSVNQIDSVICNVGLWEFYFKVEFVGNFQKVNFCGVLDSDSEPQITFYASVDFRNTKISGEARFEKVRFLDKVKFLSVDFGGWVFFDRSYFNKFTEFLLVKFYSQKVDFSDVTFAGGARFLATIFPKEILFDRAKFLKDVDFRNIIFSQQDTQLKLDGVLFGGDKINFLSNPKSEEVFVVGPANRDIETFKNYRLKEVSLKNTIFQSSTVGEFDLKFDACPDFSESHFLTKSFRIKETWQIDEEKIDKNDEPKFRFFKKYFAEQGNHFKEFEYFGYEMMAREKKLSIKDGADWFLFKCYKWFSGFGMEVKLPLFWLYISFFCFLWIFLFPLECDLKSSFSDSFAKTIMPLMKLDIGCVDSNAILTLQSLINVTLIFLLGLGIRNKFKIK